MKMNKLDIFFWGTMGIADVMFGVTWFLPSIKDNDIFLIVNVAFFFTSVIAGFLRFGLVPIYERIRKTSEMRYILNRTDISDAQKIKLLDELTA